MQTTQTLDQKTIDIVKSTVPILEERGTEITSAFYKRMFKNNPELKNIFNQTNQRKGAQANALANTVYAAAANIDQLEVILPAVMPIAEKHRSLNIKPEHYPIVGKNLLAGMLEVLGPDIVTDDVIAAWEKAYGEIARVFIEVEDNMYKNVARQEGGWIDYRDFKVVQKVPESDVITSFYLEPVDGEPIVNHEAGQYITIIADIPGEEHLHQRQYSLSCAPTEGVYRISVKREDANGDNPEGIVSNWLHKNVEEGTVIPVSAPAGDFVLKNRERPLVLISGGVGLTPMMSMLETTISLNPERDVTFIHAAHNGNVHAMGERVKEIADEYNVDTYTIYAEPTENCEGKYNKKGYINYEFLDSVLPGKDADYYFCGPKGFMQAIYKHLKDYGVAEDDINFEFFGPKQDIAG